MSARRDLIPVFVPHLGCPNACVFCNQSHITSAEARITGESVAELIREGLERAGGNRDIELAFYGGSFTAIPTDKQTELLGAVLPFLREGKISSVRVSTRPDAIDAEALERLREYGVKTVELGCQSMDEEVLRLSGRGHTARQSETAARLVKDYGFELILQMMTGLPGDSLEKSVRTARRLIALSPDGVRVYPTVIVADTPLADMWRRGEYKEHDVETAARWCEKIVPMFESAGIPVIRLGLNPSEELSGGAALAGAYHPAFGEIVRSRILLTKAEALLEKTPHAEKVTLGVNSSQLSAMIGQHRENLDKLKERFGLSEVRVVEARVKKDEVVLL